MDTIIFIIIMVGTFLLGRYILIERNRTTRLKKFWKDIEEHDKKNKSNEWDL